jgi:hypothetical protein
VQSGRPRPSLRRTRELRRPGCGRPSGCWPRHEDAKSARHKSRPGTRLGAQGGATKPDGDDSRGSGEEPSASPGSASPVSASPVSATTGPTVAVPTVAVPAGRGPASPAAGSSGTGSSGTRSSGAGGGRSAGPGPVSARPEPAVDEVGGDDRCSPASHWFRPGAWSCQGGDQDEDGSPPVSRGPRVD